MLSTQTAGDLLTDDRSATVQDFADTPSTRDQARSLASKAKTKARDVLSLPHASDDDKVSRNNDEGDLLDDAAFSSLELHDHGADATDDSSDGVRGIFDSAKQSLLHPRRAMRQKATKTTAGKVATASKPYLSSRNNRDFLDAHDYLTEAKSNATSLHASDRTSESTDTDVVDARTQVEQMEDHRESLKTAWAIGRHVDRVRVVQRSVPKPHRADYITHSSTADSPASKEHIDWPRFIARLAVYHTYGFTAHYIDDFDAPPFDIRDLRLTVERFAMVSGPWQAFFLDCRKIYTWESPKRTLQWAALFWTLWYTNHIIGYFYLWIIYATVRNRFWPSSITSIRKSWGRGADREKKAQAWSELLDRHGRHEWMEPLLDDLGPMIQLQLGDLVNFLEVLSNFYTWERPYKTAETLFVALVLLLITLCCDTTTCVKLVWLNAGGAFFFTFPIATNFPKYRRVVNLFRWFFWDVPSHAELAIIRLQEKALVNEHKLNYAHDSTSDYETATEEVPKPPQNPYTFRAYAGKASGTLSINHSGIHWHPKNTSTTSPALAIPFRHLLEMRKLEPTALPKSTKLLRPHTEPLLFIYREARSPRTQNTTTGTTGAGLQRLELNVKRQHRHAIFSLVLAWSGQKWQPMPIDRHRDHHHHRDQKQETFDRALKSALK